MYIDEPGAEEQPLRVDLFAPLRQSPAAHLAKIYDHAVFDQHISIRYKVIPHYQYGVCYGFQFHGLPPTKALRPRVDPDDDLYRPPKTRYRFILYHHNENNTMNRLNKSGMAREISAARTVRRPPCSPPICSLIAPVVV